MNHFERRRSRLDCFGTRAGQFTRRVAQQWTDPFAAGADEVAVAEAYDVDATIHGGGVNGQAGAMRLGISRALVEFNTELRKQLKKDGLLTSDSRIKERKKYGLAGARKRFQFSKR